MLPLARTIALVGDEVNSWDEKAGRLQLGKCTQNVFAHQRTNIFTEAARRCEAMDMLRNPTLDMQIVGGRSNGFSIGEGWTVRPRQRDLVERAQYELLKIRSNELAMLHHRNINTYTEVNIPASGCGNKNNYEKLSRMKNEGGRYRLWLR
jgi:hypothetical protein